MNRYLATATLAAGLLGGSQAMASPLLWQNNSLTYLYGKNFAVDAGEIQQTLTFEHASGWTWGDVFLFVDNKWFNGLSGSDGHTYYGEFSPRASSVGATCPSARSPTYCCRPPTNAAKGAIATTCSARRWTWRFPASTASR